MAAIGGHIKSAAQEPLGGITDAVRAVPVLGGNGDGAIDGGELRRGAAIGGQNPPALGADVRIDVAGLGVDTQQVGGPAVARQTQHPGSERIQAVSMVGT